MGGRWWLVNFKVSGATKGLGFHLTPVTLRKTVVTACELS